MIKIVKKSSGEYITRCGAVEKKLTPLELREISRKKNKPLKECKCGMIHNIPFNGVMEVKYAS